MILYLSLMVLIAAFIISVISLIQIIYLKTTSARPRKMFLFSEKLCNYDFDNLKFENIKSGMISLDKVNNGWGRPYGQIWSREYFEKKKAEEYSLKLP